MVLGITLFLCSVTQALCALGSCAVHEMDWYFETGDFFTNSPSHGHLLN